MSFFRASVVKDLRRARRDPTSIAISVLIPLIIGILIKLVSSGDGVPTAKLLIADEDGSFLSSFMVNALGQGPIHDLGQGGFRGTEDAARFPVTRQQADEMRTAHARHHRQCQPFTLFVVQTHPTTIAVARGDCMVLCAALLATEYTEGTEKHRPRLSLRIHPYRYLGLVALWM